MKYISVAIDGPSGAGKSTVARAAAAKLGTFAEGVAAELGRGSYYYSLKHGETGTAGAQKAEGL